MSAKSIILPLLALLVAESQCQLQYVPAQVYVPVNPHYGWNNSYNPPNNWNNIPNTNYNKPYNQNYNNGGKSESWTGPGHIFLGRIGPLDRLLFNELYYKDSRWWTSREKIIEYPNDVNSGYVRHETISAIHIINKFYQGNHANATVVSGGIGKQYVKIKLASNWGYGFRFLVQIYGR